MLTKGLRGRDKIDTNLKRSNGSNGDFICTLTVFQVTKDLVIVKYKGIKKKKEKKKKILNLIGVVVITSTESSMLRQKSHRPKGRNKKSSLSS